MTRRATQNTRNYRNSQAMGRAFIHSGFTATTHWFCVASDVSRGVAVKPGLTSQKTADCRGRYRETNLPPPGAARAHNELLHQNTRHQHFSSLSPVFSLHAFYPSFPARLRPFHAPATPSTTLSLHSSSLTGRSFQELLY